MQLSRLPLPFLAASLLLAPCGAVADEVPPGAVDARFLFSYYDQDGEHSPVTGGTGSEDLQVVSPVVLLTWRVDERWTIGADLGLDQISSASIGAIQSEVPISSASIPAGDQRVFGVLRATRRIGRQTLGLQLGGANEYDYGSFSYGIDWGVELARASTGVSASLRRYDDTIDLIGPDGLGEGSGERTTTDAFLTVSQVLGPRTTLSAELFYGLQEGVLSTPYHEVILGSGEHVGERLPAHRDRRSLGLRLNRAFGDRVVARTGYRYYEDDWGVAAHTIDLETHFRLPTDAESWLFPILRYHRQSAADAFATPGTLSGEEVYLTSDWDLAEMSTRKFGLGWSTAASPSRRGLLGARNLEVRLTRYEREDGLSGFSASLATGWRF